MWSRANRVTHHFIMASLPDMLHEECSQRPKAHVLWTYLQDRFAGETLTSAAMLWVRLLSIKLNAYPGVAGFLTDLSKRGLEIKRAGVEVPPSLMAGAILLGMGDMYPSTRERLGDLPLEQQTFEVFGNKLLQAEKDAALTAELAAFSLTTSPATTPTPATTSTQPVITPPTAVTPASALAAAPRGSGCGYIRQRQGKGQNAVVGQKCNVGTHKREQCWMLLDDMWLAANPTKGPADLPNRLMELKVKQAKDFLAKAKAQTNVTQSSNLCTVDNDNCTSSIDSSGLFLDYPLAPLGSTADRCPGGNGDACSASCSSVTVILDSGASISCFREGTKVQALTQPVTVRGATAGMSSQVQTTAVIPCPALPEGELRGLFSTSFRHNLASVSDLQQRGVEIIFPANTSQADCRDPSTGQVLWSFHRGKGGLYEVHVPASASALSASQGCHCTPAYATLHPTVLLHH